MVYIINVTFAVSQINQSLDHSNDVFLAKCALCIFSVELQTHIHLDTTNRGQVITLRIKKQRVEQS